MGRRRGRPAGHQIGFTAEVVEDEERFTALAGEWDQLYRAAPRATPFQTHGWLDAWWRAYGRPGRLRVVLVRDDDGRLVAAAPLYLRSGPVRVLAPIGGAITDFTDVLVAEELLDFDQVPRVAAALADGLLATRGWDVIDLPEVHPGAGAELLLTVWPGAAWTLPSSPVTELRVAGFDDALKRLSAKRAGEVRRRLRRSDELGLVPLDVPADDVAAGVRDLIRLHRAQWEGRGITPEHLRPRFAEHLTAALGRMIPDGSAALTRFCLDGEVVAVELELLGHDVLCGYLLGVDPALYKRMDFFTYLLRHVLRRTAHNGLSTCSMLRGREPYKEHWRPVVVPNRRLLLGRPRSAPAVVWALGARSRTRAVEFARHRAPWLRELAQRLGALRQARPRLAVPGRSR
jgi:CelD/BcsL family acetyltransferase involved in cellulose biosynthesis